MRGAGSASRPEALARLDYSKGKLTFLSDIELAASSWCRWPICSSPEFRRDRNVDKTGDIRLAGKKYEKGLAMHARTEVTFDLEGEYREFKAVAGHRRQRHPGQRGSGRCAHRGRRQGIADATRSRSKAGPNPINLNIKDVQKLRIIVDNTPDNLLGLGSLLDLADAKVSK